MLKKAHESWIWIALCRKTRQVVAYATSRSQQKDMSTLVGGHSRQLPPGTLLHGLLGGIQGSDPRGAAYSRRMSFFLDHLQAPLHLVLSSRADPDLPLARWRVRGQLIEIRDRDLLFHHAETTNFLTQMTGLSFSTEDVATLQQRTEGWIAGLQLAALSLRQHKNPSAMVASFAGNHRCLLDYVQQEILIHHTVLPGASRRHSSRCQGASRFRLLRVCLASFSLYHRLRHPPSDDHVLTQPHRGFTCVHPFALLLARFRLVDQLSLRHSSWLRTYLLPGTHARSGDRFGH